MTESTAPPITQGPQHRIGHKNKGCAIGCVLLLLLGIVLTIGGAMTLFGLYNKAVVENLSATRIPFPPLMLTEEAQIATWKRTAAFFTAIERGETPEELLLSADEVNALLDRLFVEGREELPGRVDFEGDKIHATLSIPLRGLYLNGSGTLNVGLSDGVLQVFVTELELNGKSPPAGLMELAKNHNLATPFISDPDVRAVLSRLQYVTMTQGKLKITPKPNGSK